MDEDEPMLVVAGVAGVTAADGGSAGPRASDTARANPPETDRTLDPRQRRGSLGPPPAAAPLGEAASAAAFHAHLTQLLEAHHHEQMASAQRQLALDTIGLHLTPHEDLERQPDGVPHAVIGLTALFSVLLAAVLIGVFRSGPTLGSFAASALAIIAIPVLVIGLGAKAERERDHDHPSR